MLRSNFEGASLDGIPDRRDPSALEGWILYLGCDLEESRAFLRILSTEGRGVRLCWALSLKDLKDLNHPALNIYIPCAAGQQQRQELLATRPCRAEAAHGAGERVERGLESALSFRTFRLDPIPP